MLSRQTMAHIEGICLCPEGEHSDIDVSIKPRLRSLELMTKEERNAEMVSILNDCAAYALASDFGMMILMALQDRLLGEGEEDILGKNVGVRDMEVVALRTGCRGDAPRGGSRERTKTGKRSRVIKASR